MRKENYADLLAHSRFIISSKNAADQLLSLIFLKLPIHLKWSIEFLRHARNSSILYKYTSTPSQQKGIIIFSDHCIFTSPRLSIFFC